VLLGLSAVAIGQFSPVKPEVTVWSVCWRWVSLGSWDIFGVFPAQRAANLDPLLPYVQIEGGNHALVRACVDSSAGALGESATLYVNYARSDYRCQCDDLSFSS